MYENDIARFQYTNVPYLTKVNLSDMPMGIIRLDQLSGFQNNMNAVYENPNVYFNSMSDLDRARFIMKLAMRASWKFMSDLKSMFRKHGFDNTSGGINEDLIGTVELMEKNYKAYKKGNPDYKAGSNYSMFHVTDMISAFVNVNESDSMMRAYKLFLELPCINIIKVDNGVFDPLQPYITTTFIYLNQMIGTITITCGQKPINYAANKFLKDFRTTLISRDFYALEHMIIHDVNI